MRILRKIFSALRLLACWEHRRRLIPVRLFLSTALGRIYAFKDTDDNAVVIETIKRLPQIELIAGGGVDVAALRSLRQSTSVSEFCIENAVGPIEK